MPLLYPPLFTPSLHRETHEAGGSDEINVKGLSILTSGLEADKPTPAKPGRIYWAFDSGILYRDNGNQWIKIAVKDFPDLDESSHKTTHQDGGSDELLVTGLSGLLADAQTPLAHKTTHQDGGSDELLVTGLSGLLADAQTPLAHKTTHQDGGSDVLSVAGLSGLLADRQNPRIIFKTTNINYNLDADGAWHTLDLIANTSSTAYIAFGCLTMQVVLSPATICTDFRKNGLTFIQFTFGGYTSTFYCSFWVCELDANQILQYRVSGLASAQIRLVGYME